MSDKAHLELVSLDDLDGLEVGCDHLPDRFADRTLSSFDTSVGRAAMVAHKAALQLLNRDLRALLISGPVGCGKTHLAAGVANEIGARLQRDLIRAKADYEAYLEESYKHPWVAKDHPDRAAYEKWLAKTSAPGGGPRAGVAEMTATRKLDRLCPIWLSVPAYLGRLRRGFSSGESDHSETEQAINSRALLVIDDLGAEKASDWTAATLFEIVNARYESEARTLITSNLTARQLNAAGYERIVSRMADEGALIEMATATDYRLRLRKAVS